MNMENPEVRNAVEQCIEIIRQQFVGTHVEGHQYRNRGLSAAEFVICDFFKLKMKPEPLESFKN